MDDFSLAPVADAQLGDAPHVAIEFDACSSEIHGSPMLKPRQFHAMSARDKPRSVADSPFDTEHIRGPTSTHTSSAPGRGAARFTPGQLRAAARELGLPVQELCNSLEVPIPPSLAAPLVVITGTDDPSQSIAIPHMDTESNFATTNNTATPPPVGPDNGIRLPWHLKPKLDHPVPDNFAPSPSIASLDVIEDAFNLPDIFNGDTKSVFAFPPALDASLIFPPSLPVHENGVEDMLLPDSGYLSLEWDTEEPASPSLSKSQDSLASLPSYVSSSNTQDEAACDVAELSPAMASSFTREGTMTTPLSSTPSRAVSISSSTLSPAPPASIGLPIVLKPSSARSVDRLRTGEDDWTHVSPQDQSEYEEAALSQGPCSRVWHVPKVCEPVLVTPSGRDVVMLQSSNK